MKARTKNQKKHYKTLILLFLIEKRVCLLTSTSETKWLAEQRYALKPDTDSRFTERDIKEGALARILCALTAMVALRDSSTSFAIPARSLLLYQRN